MKNTYYYYPYDMIQEGVFKFDEWLDGWDFDKIISDPKFDMNPFDINSELSDIRAKIYTKLLNEIMRIHISLDA